MWPNAVALAAECWPDKSRPVVAGLLGAAVNGGILLLSQIVRIWHVTPDSWRWLFSLAAVPGVLGVLVLLWLPESPRWLASRGPSRSQATPTWALFPSAAAAAHRDWHPARFDPDGRRLGGQQVDDSVGRQDRRRGLRGLQRHDPGLVGAGALLGSYFGAQIATWLGRRRAYALISLAATVLT